MLSRQMEQPPFVRGEPRDGEKDDADADVAENDAHPDFLRQRVQETEDARLLLDGFFDHDGDTQRHEGLAEVDDSFPF